MLINIKKLAKANISFMSQVFALEEIDQFLDNFLESRNDDFKISWKYINTNLEFSKKDLEFIKDLNFDIEKILDLEEFKDIIFDIYSDDDYGLDLQLIGD